MKRQLRNIAVVAVLLASPSFAHAEDIFGKIALVDPVQHTVTLTNGMTFFVENPLSMIGLVPGEDVKVTFDHDNRRVIVIEQTKSDKKTS